MWFTIGCRKELRLFQLDHGQMANYLFRRINTTTLLLVDACDPDVVWSLLSDVPRNVRPSRCNTQFDTDLCVDGIYIPKQHINTGIISRIISYKLLCNYEYNSEIIGTFPIIFRLLIIPSFPVCLLWLYVNKILYLSPVPFVDESRFFRKDLKFEFPYGMLCR